MRDLIYSAAMRARAEFVGRTRRPFARYLSPFEHPGNGPLIIHCCYHKVGTVWFGRILRDIAAEFGLRYRAGGDFREIHRLETNGDSDIFMDLGSHVKFAALPGRYKLSHMIRDPRDLIVSGYFYHRWTDEPWANFPRAEFRGMSYREYLNSVPKDVGIAAEIERNNFWIHHMAEWDFCNANAYEIRYEDILDEEENVLRAMFRHYEFHEQAVERALKIARRYSFETIRARGGAGETSHLRSGKSGEWRKHFSASHVAQFKQLFPGVLARLKYEAGDDWSLDI